MLRRRFHFPAIAATLGLLASSAFAHPGHTTGGLTAGFAHPLSGIDHLLTMLAIGLWAAQIGKRAAWFLPLTFITAMLAGAAIAFRFPAVPPTAIDQAIAASLLLVGILILTAIRMPLPGAATLTALFALFHGYAHAAELQPTLSAATYIAGFSLTTALLHLAGITTALALFRLKSRPLVRLSGVLCILTALCLLGGLL